MWPDPALLHDAADRATRYLAELPQRRVAPDAGAVARLRAQVGAPLPEEGADPAQVLDELDRLASAATLATAGPRFFGFVQGGVLPAPLAASWLAGAWDQNAFSSTCSPAAVALEEIALGWLRSLFGLPNSCEAAFTTGATLANFTALAAARHAVLEKVGWNVEAHGLFGAPPVTVAVSAESHPTVSKGLGMLGLGRERVIVLPTDSQGRIRVDALPQLRGPAIVCCQAGNVNSGAFDPFDALREWSDESGAWLHVDGAFGLWALAAPARRHLAAGIERADSWATDAHKWLNVPYDSGIAFVRHAEALRQAMSFEAPYLPAEAPREPFHTTPETSRRARGVEIWAALRQLGRRGVGELVETSCRQATRFAEGLRDAGYKILGDVVLNQVVVRFGDEATNARVIDAIQQAGVCWAGPTKWQGQSAMRISVSCWATTDADVEQSLTSILECARRVVGKVGKAG